MDWNCADKLAAVALTFVGVAYGDPGTMVGGAVGAAGLLGAWRVTKCKYGLESEKQIEHVRKHVLAECLTWARAEGVSEVDLMAADYALEQHLVECMPDLATLAELARDRARYPKAAAEHVLIQLAKRDGLFEASSSQFSVQARDFALNVIERALSDAMQHEAYAAKLRTAMMVEMLSGLREVQDLVEAAEKGSRNRDAAQAAQIARIETLLSGVIPPSVLRETVVQELMARPGSSDEELAAAVRTFRSDHDRLLAKLSQIEVFDNRIAALKADAVIAFNAYNHQKVASLYASMRKITDERTLESLLRGMEFVAGEAEALLLAREWEAALAVWQDAAAKLQPFDPFAAQLVTYTAARTLIDFGQRYPGGAIFSAIALLRPMVAITITPMNTELIAQVSNTLGLALQYQGERSGGADGVNLLNEAAATYSAALELFKKERRPADWAMLQNNLGLVLRIQGERTGGIEGIILLNRAASANYAALDIYTKSDLPSDWAMTQNNLGLVLRIQAQRCQAKESVALLDQAIAAFRAALEIRTKASMPVDWAMTQNNLGNALRGLAELDSGTNAIALLDQAIAAFRAALEVRTRNAMPAAWATTQSNLGNAFFTQGAEDKTQYGLLHFDKAIAAFSAALEVHTREAMPVDWAMVQNNLGNSFLFKGKRTESSDGLVIIDKAVMAYRSALEVYTMSEIPVSWASAKYNLGVALSTLGERCGNEEGLFLLEEGVAAFRSALEVNTREVMVSIWAMTQENMGDAFRAMANLTNGVTKKCHLRSAVAAYLLALEVFDPLSMASHHESATTSLARVRRQLDDS